MVRPMTERMSVVGVFSNRRDAQAAVRELKAAGFRDDEIGVVGPGDGESLDGGTHAAEGAATGVAAGAGIGALWAVGIAAGLLPAIGPVIAGGIFASILASAAGGAAVAGIAGALVGMGIPEDEADYYENEFKAGRTVVTVKTTSRQDEARAILGRSSGYDMESRPDRAVGTGSTTSTTASAARSVADDVSDAARRAKDKVVGAAHRTADTLAADRTAVTDRTASVGRTGAAGQKVQLREEVLDTQKVQKEVGEVRVRKDVVTERKTIEVPVTREEVVIERHAVPGTRAAGDISASDMAGEVRIAVKEEEVRVTKTPVVKEEVTVGKRKTTETRTVAADVKHEELRVEQTGDAHLKGTDPACDTPRKSR